MDTVRLTVGQAIVRFLQQQFTERDGVEHRFVEGCFGIFGHGNVAGLGQALLEAELADPAALRYYQGRNEQAMVHAAAAFARVRNRMSTLACTSSIGPGATNMVTGAALATINRLPVLLLPGDVFATRVANPVLQELESPAGYDVSVNDAFRPVSRFFDRVWRPEQLPAALLGAMRVLTDPAETGAATVALPQDVQAEAYDWPAELFENRVWHVPRPAPDPAALDRAATAVGAAARPLIVAGGGVKYSDATEALREFAEAVGIPVAETQAGKGALPFDHPQNVGSIGVTGSSAANALAAEADLILAIGTRLQDFTTGSRALVPGAARLVQLNVAPFDAGKHGALTLVGDAKRTLEALSQALGDQTTPAAWQARATGLVAEWNATVERVTAVTNAERPSDAQVLGAVNRHAPRAAIVVCAAGGLPGELHKLWRTGAPGGYHLEYGFSCMGYEIAGGLGVKMAQPDREVFVLVGDGSYLMLNSELATSVMLGRKLTVVVLDNRGYGCIDRLQRATGGASFNNLFDHVDHMADPAVIDLAGHARALGAEAEKVASLADLEAALERARASSRTSVIVMDTDPLITTDEGGYWWDVAVPEASERAEVRQARAAYERALARQKLA
jgi:3D-(3,5/4)-trihydroxycyclohexane-1,2-dione acylhydrolase (decyclizing)